MTATRTRRPNTYAGTCSRCGGRVETQTGLLGPKVDNRWTVEHTECPTVEISSTRVSVARPARRRNTDSAQWVMGPHGMVRSRRRNNYPVDDDE